MDVLYFRRGDLALQAYLMDTQISHSSVDIGAVSADCFLSRVVTLELLRFADTIPSGYLQARKLHIPY